LGATLYHAWAGTAPFGVGLDAVKRALPSSRVGGPGSTGPGGAKAAATVTGMLDGVQYVASGLTGFFLGSMLDKYGWGIWVWTLIPFSVIGALLMTRLWNETPLRDPQTAVAPEPEGAPLE